MKKRPYMPLSVKLAACLLLLGFTWDEVRAGGKAIQWDHAPALGLRAQTGRRGRIIYTPAANDPRYIRPMAAAAHHQRTATIDAPAIAKTRRITKAHEAFRARLLAKANGEPSPITKKRRAWPKRPFQSI